MSIQTSIILNNQMTPVLESINKSMMLTINTMENMAMSSENMFDTATLTEAKEHLSRSIVELNNIEKETFENINAQREYNSEISKSHGLLDGIKGKVIGIVGAYAGLRSLKWFQETSDEMTNIQSRLAMIVDENKTVAELQDMIFYSAQRSRGEYKMTLDVVSKLASQAKNAFASNAETVKFAENLNKLFAISGTSSQGIESVMYNLTQAMASGVLRGQDLNAVISNTPQLLQIVAEHMGTDISMIRKLAEEGELTAQVIKNALLEASATEEINAQFEQMPMTFSQIATMTKNVFLRELQPALAAFNNMLNSENFKQVVNNMVALLGILARVIKEVVEIGINGFNLMYNVIDVIKIPLLAVVGLMALYKGLVVGSTIVESVKTGVSVLHAKAMSMVAIATGKATAIQGAYNSVLWASPLFIIPAILILIVAGIFAVVGAINKVQGKTISALGIITGAIATAGALIFNMAIGLINSIIQLLWTGFVYPFLGIIEWILNVTQGGFDSFGDGVANLIGTIIGWFLELGKVVTTIIDAIFGTDWTGGLNNLQAEVTAWGKNKNAITLEKQAPLIETRFGYKDTWNKGYSWGAEKEQKITKWFNNTFELDANDYTDSLMDLSNLLGDIKEDTGDISDEISWSNNDLTGLRDLMMQRAITDLSKEVKIEVYNEYTGEISSEIDIDTLKKEVSDEIVNALDIALEGGV